MYVYWKIVMVVCNGNLSLVLCDHFSGLYKSFGYIVGAKKRENEKFKNKTKKIKTK